MATPELTPWIDERRLVRDGIALACRSTDGVCNAAADRIAAQYGSSLRREVELSRRYFGVNDPALRYRILAVPPKP